MEGREYMSNLGNGAMAPENSENGHALEKVDASLTNGKEYQPQQSQVGLLEIDVATETKSGKKRGQKQSMLTPIILICALISIALIIAGAVAAAVVLSRSQDEQNASEKPTASTTSQTPTSGGLAAVCRTVECASLVRLLQTNMDATVDPCENFYNFACGGWVKNAKLPADSSSYGQLNVLFNERVEAELKRILQNDTVRSGEVEAVSKVKEIYRLCNDMEAINRAEAKPVLDLINATGGWNLVDGGRAGEWSINSTSFAREKLYSSSAFFRFFVSVDDKNSSRFIIKIIQGALSLPGILYIRNNVTAINSFREYFIKVMSLINPTVSNETYRMAADGIINFEKRLVWIQSNPAALNNPSKVYNKMTLRNLVQQWPDYDWVSSFQYIFSQHNVSIGENEEVVVITPHYFQRLSAIFQNTSVDTLENYAKWQFISFFIPYLSQPFLDAYYIFQHIGEPKRTKTCIQFVQLAYPMATARPYIESVYPVKRLDSIREMVKEVTDAFRKRINQKDWLDDFTKAQTQAKLDKIISKVAYPDWLFNDTYLNSLTALYPVHSESFYRTVVGTRYAFLGSSWASLHDPVDRLKWQASPTFPNAFYSRYYNEIILLAAILLPPIVSPEWPDYYNYGALGSTIIGHELTHGFDDSGQQYDQNGNLRVWWSNSSIQNFQERKKCFQAQYSKYTFFGHKINGGLTLGENIADNGGLMTSFQAYRTSVKGKKQQARLPGFEYTPDQIFFIAQAQSYCSVYNKDKVEERIRTAAHAPDPYRVIGPLSNSKDFSDAFQCPSGSPMNPINKCLLW